MVGFTDVEGANDEVRFGVGRRWRPRGVPRGLLRLKHALYSRYLPVALGYVAGYVDGCTFVALFGLFVAQVTGSFVIVGAVLGGNKQDTLMKLLAIPAFVFGAVVATALSAISRHSGLRASPVLLGLETLLLGAMLATALSSRNIEKCRPAGRVERRPPRALRDGDAERLRAAAYRRRALHQCHDNEHRESGDRRDADRYGQVARQIPVARFGPDR